MDNYFIKIGEYRKNISWSDITLEKIKNVLYSFFKVKDRRGSYVNVDELAPDKDVGKAKMTTAEKELWIAAQYPNLEMFLKKLRGK